jgi:hypothetical protein
MSTTHLGCVRVFIVMAHLSSIVSLYNEVEATRTHCSISNPTLSFTFHPSCPTRQLDTLSTFLYILLILEHVRFMHGSFKQEQDELNLLVRFYLI